MTLGQAIDSLKAYTDHGVPTGGFLQAVLENDLFEAIGRADDSSLVHLQAICRYVYNEMPSNVHGSRERVAAHLARKAAVRA